MKNDIFDKVFNAKNLGEYISGYIKIACWFGIAIMVFFIIVFKVLGF